MKRLAFALLAALSFLPAGPALAGVSCSSIDDPDQRAYCRAQQTKSAGQCVAISDHALRQTCRARLASPGKGASQCNSIWNSWEREKCRDEAERK